MKPLFTIHAGEYLVGTHIEKRFKDLNLWLPAKDSGIDLMVSDRRNRRTVSLQIKFSKDFLPNMTAARRAMLLNGGVRACGWFVINRDKVRASAADLWVLALLGFASRTTDYVVIPPGELYRRLAKLHRDQKTIQSYLWVMDQKRCWETRGLRRDAERQIADGKFQGPDRDFTEWLNAWGPLKKLEA